MPAPYKIRAASSADAEGLVRLQTQIYQEGRWFVGDGPPTVEALARRLRVLDDDSSLYLVAAAGQGKLCGWLELHRLQPRRLRHVAVLTLAVAPEWRRRRVASALLERAYPWARRARVEKIQLNVRGENKAAIGLYSAQGFVLEGRERRQIREAGRYEDNLLMAKFLDTSLDEETSAEH